MSGLPALNEEDQDAFARTLDHFLGESRALRAFLIASAGYQIVRAGERPEVDSETFAALASNAFNAIDALAQCLEESDFKVLHQRGGRHQTLIFRIDDSCLLVAIFPSKVGIHEIEGAAGPAITSIQDQLAVARLRIPSVNVDLADHNPHSAETIFFRRKTD